MGHYFFRLMGEETHELPFKVKRIIPGGVVAIFGEVQACMSGQLLPLIFVLGGSSRNGKAGPVISASCLMESNSRKWACGERQRYCPCRLCLPVKLGQNGDGDLELLSQGLRPAEVSVTSRSRLLAACLDEERISCG